MPIIFYEGKGEVSTMYLSLGKRTIRLGLFCYKTENSIFHIVNIVVVSLRPLHSPTNPASANHPLTPGNGQEGPCLAFGYKSFSVPTLLQYTAKNAFFSPLKVELIQNVHNRVKSCLKSYFLHLVFHEIFVQPWYNCKTQVSNWNYNHKMALNFESAVSD